MNISETELWTQAQLAREALLEAYEASDNSFVDGRINEVLKRLSLIKSSVPEPTREERELASAEANKDKRFAIDNLPNEVEIFT